MLHTVHEKHESHEKIDVEMSTRWCVRSGSQAPAGEPRRRGSRLYTHNEVGRNKPVRALSAGQAFPASRCSEVPETPALAAAWRSYSGLHPNAPR